MKMTDDGGTLSTEEHADPTLKEALSLVARSKGDIASIIISCSIRLYTVVNLSAIVVPSVSD